MMSISRWAFLTSEHDPFILALHKDVGEEELVCLPALDFQPNPQYNLTQKVFLSYNQFPHITSALEIVLTFRMREKKTPEEHRAA